MAAARPTVNVNEFVDGMAQDQDATGAAAATTTTTNDTTGVTTAVPSTPGTPTRSPQRFDVGTPAVDAAEGPPSELKQLAARMEAQLSQFAAFFEKAACESEALSKRLAALEKPTAAAGATDPWFRPVAPPPGAQTAFQEVSTPVQPQAAGGASHEPLKPLHHKHIHRRRGYVVHVDQELPQGLAPR